MTHLMIDPNANLEHMVRSLFGGERTAECTWCPPFDVMETADAVIVRADLPGVDPESLEISVQENVLLVKGEKPVEARPEELRAYRFERRAGAFERALRLPETVDSGKISAESKHGVLTITLPKREEIQPKRVQITVK